MLIIFTSTAAAICIKPESFVNTKSLTDNKSIASSILVSPVKLNKRSLSFLGT